MSKKSFILHIDSLDILDDLTLEQCGELFKAIKAYQTEQEITLTAIANIAFSPFKNQFKRDDEKYQKTCKRRAEAGSLGGKQKVANASKSKQKVANLADSKNKSKNKKDSKSDNESESDSKLYIVDSMEVIEHLNSTNKSNFKPTDSNINPIKARLVEGHTKQEILDVVSMKYKEWDGTSMAKYIRPSTLFNAEKFNQYVGALPEYYRDLNGEVDWLPKTSNVIEGEVLHG